MARGHVPGAILHCSPVSRLVWSRRGGQHPTPGCTACPIALALPRDPLVTGRESGQQGSGTEGRVALQGTLLPSRGIDPRSAI